jgi:hypothetical protein
MNGKGDTPRPMQVSRQQYEENWASIFGLTKKPRKKGRHSMTQPLNEPKDYTGSIIVLPDTARAIKAGERVACNCCGETGTVIETETGNHVLRYCVEWDSGPVIWTATNRITPLSDRPRPVCVFCRTNHPPGK